MHFLVKTFTRLPERVRSSRPLEGDRKGLLRSIPLIKTLLGVYILLSGLSATAQTVATYNYTGAVQSFTVSASGIVTINCKGAKGADGIPGYVSSSLAGTGALGGTVEGTYPVAAGQVLYIWVGGAASGSTGGVNGGANGNHSSGGGGGASDIRLGDVTLSSRIMVAGGGGGGGNGGSSASNLFGGNGGVGGGGAGTNGTNSIGGFGGIGASGSTGGAAGGGCSFALGTAGGNGAAGIGGAGGTGLALSPTTIYSSGGGGGGGYSGGGGGGAGSAGTYSCTLNETGAGAGGAGGSNYIASGFTSTTSTQGTGPSGNGVVVITFTAFDPITGTLAVCAGSTTSLSNATTGGTWSSSDIAIATINSSGVVSGVAAGTATISYVLSGATVTAVVTVNPLPAGSAVVNNVLCNGGNTGSINLTVNGGTTPYNFSWNGGAITEDRTGLVAGDYSVTITDAKGCKDTVSETLTQPSALSATGTYTAVSCNGGSNGVASVSVSGGTPSYLYSWAPSGGTGATATGLAAGNYTVTITDNNSCTKTHTVTVTQPSAVVTFTAVTTVSCYGGSNGVASITASGGVGGYTYSWAPGGAITSAITGLAAGVYTATVTDANGCTATKRATVTQPATAVSIGSISSNGPVCSGATLSLSGSTASGGVGSFSYFWEGPNSFSSIALNPSLTSVTADAAGIYTFTATDANSCSASGTVSVTVNPLPDAGTITGTASVCETSTTTLSNTAVGGTWSTGDPIVASVDLDGVVSGNAAGTATISYSATTVCGTATTTQVVTVNPLPNAGTITGTASVCEASTTTLSNAAVGGTWSTDAPGVASVDLDGVVSGNAAGTATISYSATTVCGTATTTQIVTVNPLPNAGTITGTASVCETSTTTLSNAAAGTGAWTIDATGAATIDVDGVVSGLAAGTATVTYTATTVCGTATTTQVVTVNPLPNAGTITGTASVCESSATTLTDASAGGVWTSDALGKATVNSTGVVSGVSAGTATISYVVTNGCGIATTTQIVTVNPLPDAGSITGAANVCMSIPTTLTNAIGGGAWATGAAGIATISSAGVVSGVSAGTTTISYSITNGCGTATATHVVTVVPLPVAGTIAGTASVCPGNTTSLSNAVTGGVWSAGASTIATINSGGIVSGIAAGTATITYMVSNVCGTATATQIVTVNPLPDAGTITGAASVCEKSTITLSDAVSGGTWSMNVAGIVHITGSGLVLGVAAGTATITYTVSNVCGTDYTTKVVTVNPLPNAGSISGTASVNKGGTTTLSNTITGGTWSTGAATVATVNASGIVTGVSVGTAVISYTVTNGCSASATTIVTVNPVGTGIVTGAANVNISLYPNPTTGAFAVNTPEAGNLSIYTLEGREVMSATVNAGTTSLSLPSTMATGIYMCRFTGSNGALVTIRMVYEH
jgi:uncharacterized protein YjdB